MNKTLFPIFLFVSVAAWAGNRDSFIDDLPGPALLNIGRPNIALRCALAPPVAYILTMEDSLHHRDYYWVENDSESPEPLIIKISPLKYLVYKKGMMVIHVVEDGAENIFDKFFGIQPPPKDPPGGDSSDYWKDGNSRWEYKP